ncbi:sensor domain-containing protein [Rhodococcus sp. MEB064]|uniref:sensor domain-containing protein n=1 Tax=Rhodococcus sp. MEB064 TaxID=1587522 RepID=UPI0005AC6761|nr:EAL domain-containing protein [Rhodococcus sp. MEB064]
MTVEGLGVTGLPAVLDAAPDLVAVSDPRGRVLYMNPAGIAMVGAAGLDAVRRLSTWNFFSDVGLLTAPDVERSLQETGLWRGLGELRRIDTGDPIPVSISTFVVPQDGASEPLVAAVMQRRGTSEDDDSAPTPDLASAAYRIREQSAISELGRRAVDGDLDTILAVTTGAATALRGTECSSVARLNEAGTALDVVGYSGVSEPPTRFGLGTRSAPGLAVSTGELVVCPDAAEERRFDTSTMESRGLASAVCVPFHSASLPGVLTVHSASPRDFSVRDLRFLQTAADILAAAIRRIELEQELRYRSLHDPLTGLGNRTLAYRRIEEATAHVRDSDTTVAVILADLDDFKTVNDSLGHSHGDAALISLSRKLEHVVPGGDTVARLGGDEFLVVCEHVVDEDDARRRAQRISRALSTVDTRDDQTMAFSASIGIGIALLQHPDTSAEEMVRRADLAMYRAKATAPGTIDVFDIQDKYEADRVFRLAADLRQSLADNSLRVEYQPIFGLEKDAVVSVEALARWDHPTLGAVPPSEFVAVAERTGLVGTLGDWALDTACRDALDWPDHITVRVNVSAHQLNDPDFAESVTRVLERTGLPATRLGLEITEMVWVQENTRVARTLSKLHDMGVTLALDDLGTGHSSIAYLDRYPIFDCLKIDGSYIGALPGVRPHAIVSAIVMLGDAFGVEVVGEGVETAEQAEAYRSCGGRLAQGYHLGRPMPSAAVRALLEERARPPHVDAE